MMILHGSNFIRSSVLQNITLSLIEIQSYFSAGRRNAGHRNAGRRESLLKDLK